MEARDAWMYDEAVNKGTAYGTIIRRQDGKPASWPRIDTANGVKKAVFAYAKWHSLPAPKPRKAGSRKRK